MAERLNAPVLKTGVPARASEVRILPLPFFMDFKELQQKVVKNALAYGERHELQIDKDFAIIKLFEEVGELAQAVLIHNKKCRKSKRVPDDASKKELAKELADVVGLAILNAHLLDIDLEDAINTKWINKEK